MGFFYSKPSCVAARQCAYSHEQMKPRRKWRAYFWRSLDPANPCCFNLEQICWRKKWKHTKDIKSLASFQKVHCNFLGKVWTELLLQQCDRGGENKRLDKYKEDTASINEWGMEENGQECEKEMGRNWMHVRNEMKMRRPGEAAKKPPHIQHSCGMRFKTTHRRIFSHNDKSAFISTTLNTLAKVWMWREIVTPEWEESRVLSKCIFSPYAYCQVTTKWTYIDRWKPFVRHLEDWEQKTQTETPQPPPRSVRFEHLLPQTWWFPATIKACNVRHIF